MLTANNWNVAQYAILMHMMAQVSGLEAGELVHVIADAHIYDRHIPIVKEIIENQQYPAPRLLMNKDITDFYAFTRKTSLLRTTNTVTRNMTFLWQSEEEADESYSALR